jgi:hypothetical protein
MLYYIWYYNKTNFTTLLLYQVTNKDDVEKYLNMYIIIIIAKYTKHNSL